MLSITLASACVSPGGELNDAARNRDYRVVPVAAGEFQLTAYLPNVTPPGGRWHVYLTGDGSPWWRGRVPSGDPTPRADLALRLMDADAAPRLLLHRPCYGLDAMPANCVPGLWTGGRYAPAVVAALNAALDRLADDFNIGELVLIGYSGGGTLARLLASRRDDVAALVTVAANLDHRAWTRHHGYLPLTASLNAAATAPLPAGVVQRHLVGADDTRVPPAIVRGGIAGDPNAVLDVRRGFDHRCCWPVVWPDVLAEIESAIERSAPGRPQ